MWSLGKIAENASYFLDNKALILGSSFQKTRNFRFVDAAHFVLGAFLAILWSFRRIFVETSSGRYRLNVLGALNAVTKEMITVINTTYINSWSVVELMRKIREIHPEGKIVLVLDNARYQACYLVKSGANMLNIDLLFLPPYSPNLNLIERVWKFIRKKCLNPSYPTRGNSDFFVKF